MDQKILELAVAEGWKDGSTAAVAVIVDGDLIIGNLGDSEAILVKSRPNNSLEIVNLTTIHKPTQPDEQQRIEKLGGKIYSGRVYGTLAVSRAFGDIAYKLPKASNDFVSALPAVRRVTLDPTCKSVDRPTSD